MCILFLCVQDGDHVLDAEISARLQGSAALPQIRIYPTRRAPLGPIWFGGLNILSSYGLVQQVGVRKPRRLKAG